MDFHEFSWKFMGFFARDNGFKVNKEYKDFRDEFERPKSEYL